ncbi:MAG: DUF4157 domain-containing protein [Chitinophagaceae bacterium]
MNLAENTECYIKENSFIAKWAAWKLGSTRVAIVVGRTIHLHNTSRQEFIANNRWVRHEVAHIKQFREHGYLAFIMKYLWESIRKGYTNNKYEIEARRAEGDEDIFKGIVLV